jgi:hypothetical protein
VVASEYRLQYKDQPLDEKLYVAMNPIAAGPEREPHIFVLGHNADGLFLDAILARPDDKWHPNSEFIFCLKSVEK